MSLGSFNRLGAVFGLLIGLWLAIVTVGQRWRGWTTSVGAIIAGAIGAAAAILFNWRFALPRTIWVPVTAIIVAEAAYGVLLTALAARRSGRGWTAVGAHLGLLMILAGVAGSSIVTEDRTALLSPGQTVDFAGRNVRLDTIGPEMASGGSVMTARAELTIATPGGKSYTMRPARRFSMQTEEQMPEVAVRSRPLDDFYIAVNAYEARTGRVSLTLHRAALVMWLWVGSALVSLAGLAAGLARSRQKEMPLP